MRTSKKRNYGSATFWITNAVYVIIVCSAFYISSTMSINGIIAKDSAMNILKALLDVDVALVAFFGLILVFHLNYVNSVKERIAQQRHETNVDRDRFSLDYLIGVDKVSSDTLPSLKKAYDEIDRKYSTRIEELEKEFHDLILQIASISISAIITIIFIFIDILLTVYYLGTINNGLPFMDLVFVLVVLLVVLYSITTELVFLQPKTERIIFSQELKKLWSDAQQKRRKDEDSKKEFSNSKNQSST